MALSDRHPSARRSAAAAPTTASWRRALPAADTMFALFALAAALVVIADFAATF